MYNTRSVVPALRILSLPDSMNVPEKLSWNFGLEFKHNIEPPDYYFDQTGEQQSKANPVNMLEFIKMKEKK